MADNGVGIDPKFAERIFAIFQRLPTRQERAGAGYRLGCMYERMVEATRTHWKSEVGKGSIFYLTIPNRGEIEKVIDLTDDDAA